ncbi:hypothetical protein BTW15_17675 [Pseudomonas syringae pv. tomato]|uniref:Uncharacterized protein n=9 Tax=Pseudomonas syringae group TaxID=136849 RepID=A0A0Q0A9W8_PSESX|nr:hypothetical protein PSPTO_4811 [Pseudomonas syringae pv. tomato str. DC3000]AVI86695.1 hypothetical protein XJ28_24835 [Pseudomonas syringae pv. tomato]KPB68620.1 Uncharacterized protein AC506_4711 [Pseudomonas syringae pv. maculicola str. M6]KPC06973.1 Uncharacterized protein AC503_4730 [Pseudomonas syringae pv. maculicola]KPW40664.1 hypothetical protein ALO87_100888 [Pseudomonas syringae pv. apii]KPW48256.1 hypothetical protein ALO86_100709 [Pseudomonas syringae pv. berberidis]KPW51603.
MLRAAVKARLTALSGRWSQFYAGSGSAAKLKREDNVYLR